MNERGVVTKACEWISNSVPGPESRFWTWTSGWATACLGGATILVGIAWRVLRRQEPLHNGYAVGADLTFIVWIGGQTATFATLVLAYCAFCFAPRDRRWSHAAVGAILFTAAAILWNAWSIPLFFLSLATH